MGGFLAFRLRRLVWDARHRLRPAAGRQVDASDREALFGSAGFVLTTPTEQLRGIYLVNGTRLPEFGPIAADVRERYVTVLTHWWELSPQRLREYRRLAALFDCVESVSVPWVHKRPLAWLRDVRGCFDRAGGGTAVYMTKREPNEKEDGQ